MLSPLSLILARPAYILHTTRFGVGRGRGRRCRRGTNDVFEGGPEGEGRLLF